MSRAHLIYDGDCGFCTWCAIRARTWVRAQVEIVPWQRADLAALKLSAAQCQEAVQWVGPAGQQVSGAQAIAQTFHSGRQPWRLFGVMLGSKVLRRPADFGYRWVAAHRDLFPGATPTCAKSD